MDDLEKALPIGITNQAVRFGNELLLPLDETKQAVRIASDVLIAVLGIEVFRILDAGLGVELYSGYEFARQEDWRIYVRSNNDAALQYIEEHRFGNGCGYVLTATSEKEFSEMTPPAQPEP
jgi:hypothetical protein